MAEKNIKIKMTPMDVPSMYPDICITGESHKAVMNSIYGTGMFNSKTEIKNEESKDEEWIWVEGYKGTNKDMRCRDYQFEIGKQFNMDEDAEIKVCERGFHLCPELSDVFRYYDIGDGNRFFKVSALVRKNDYENPTSCHSFGFNYFTQRVDKFAAKSIIFLDEIGPDEVFEAAHKPFTTDWTIDDKKRAMETSIRKVKERMVEEKLIEIGYSPVFAKYCVTNGKYDVAYAVGTQPELSMDMKVFAIFNGDDDYKNSWTTWRRPMCPVHR